MAQATRLHVAFALVSVATCGLGFVLLGIPVHLASLKAAEAARRGEWHRVPVVGGRGPSHPTATGERTG